MSKSWQEMPLGEVLTERQEVPREQDLLTGNIRIIAKIGFNDGKIQLREETNTRTKMILIRPGDLVVSGINAAKGAIAIYGEENKEPVAATIHYGAYTPNKNKVEVKYLWWLLRSNTFKELLTRYVPGGIKTELKAKRLLPVPIPLPPLSEQRQIVEKIEKIVEKIEEVKILRKENDKKINYLYDSFANSIFNNISISKYKFTIGEYIDRKVIYLNKESRNPQYDEESKEFIYIDISSVGQGPLVINDGKTINCVDAPSRARRVMHKNDIIFSTVRPNLKTVAKVGKDLDGQICSTGYAVFTCSTEIDSDFLLYQMSSSFFINQCMEKTTGGHYPAINDNNLKQVFIVVPPKEEQKRIVDRLKTFNNDIQLNIRQQHSIEQRVEVFLPSLIDKAFKGELN